MELVVVNRLESQNPISNVYILFPWAVKKNSCGCCMLHPEFPFSQPYGVSLLHFPLHFPFLLPLLEEMRLGVREGSPQKGGQGARLTRPQPAQRYA